MLCAARWLAAAGTAERVEWDVTPCCATLCCVLLSCSEPLCVCSWVGAVTRSVSYPAIEEMDGWMNGWMGCSLLGWMVAHFCWVRLITAAAAAAAASLLPGSFASYSSTTTAAETYRSHALGLILCTRLRAETAVIAFLRHRVSLSVNAGRAVLGHDDMSQRRCSPLPFPFRSLLTIDPSIRQNQLTV